MKTKKYKSLKNKKYKKNKTYRKIRKYTKGMKGGKIPPHQYLFFDKDHFPISQSRLDTVISLSYGGIENIRDNLKKDKMNEQMRRSSILYLMDPSITTIFGYISGYTYEDKKDGLITLVISFVELHSSVRGLGLCVPMLDVYLKNLSETTPEIKKAHLYNIGGERSCRCYKKAFEMNDFTMRGSINCSNPDSDLILFFK